MKRDERAEAGEEPQLHGGATQWCRLEQAGAVQREAVPGALQCHRAEDREQAGAVQRAAAVHGALQCGREEARELASTLQCGTAVLSGTSGTLAAAVQQEELGVSQWNTAMLSGAVPGEAAAAAVKWTEQCCAETARLLLPADSFSFFQKIFLFFKKIYWQKNFHKSKKFVVNPLMESLQPQKLGPSHSQCPPCCQKPKKARHVQDLKAP